MDAAAVNARTSRPQPRPSSITADATTAGVALAVDPEDALADSGLRVCLEGLQAGVIVTLRTHTTDEFGQAWRAEVAVKVGPSILRRHALRVADDDVRHVPLGEAGVVGMLAVPPNAGRVRGCRRPSASGAARAARTRS